MTRNLISEIVISLNNWIGNYTILIVNAGMLYRVSYMRNTQQIIYLIAKRFSI